LKASGADIKLTPVVLKERLLRDTQEFHDVDRRKGVAGGQFDNLAVHVGRAMRGATAFAYSFRRLLHSGLEKPLGRCFAGEKKSGNGDA
ncbi:hypothetical protein ACC697_38630, partial [Rhizobium ruizarguesonis]